MLWRLARELDAERFEPLPTDVTAKDPDEQDENFSPLGHRILEAIEGLPQTDRAIFQLVRLGGMTQIEAAAALGITA